MAAFAQIEVSIEHCGDKKSDLENLDHIIFTLDALEIHIYVLQLNIMRKSSIRMSDRVELLFFI